MRPTLAARAAALLAVALTLPAAIVAPPATAGTVRTLLRVAVPPGGEGIRGIAMDGGRIAVEDAARGAACPSRTRLLRVDGSAVTLGGCPRHDALASIALGGTRVLEVQEDAGNRRAPYVLLGAPGVAWRRLAAYPPGSDERIGPFLGPVAGSAGTLVYASWAIPVSPPGCDIEVGPCTFGPPTGTVRTAAGAALWTGSGALAPVQAEGSRIALFAAAYGARVIDASGHVLGTYPRSLIGTDAHAVAVAGSVLVVLRPRSIDVRDVATGRLRRRLPVPSGFLNWRVDAAVSRGRIWIAVSTHDAVYAVRLADGRRVRLDTSATRGVRDAQIEREGVAWQVRERVAGGFVDVVRWAPVPR